MELVLDKGGSLAGVVESSDGLLEQTNLHHALFACPRRDVFCQRSGVAVQDTFGGIFERIDESEEFGGC